MATSRPVILGIDIGGTNIRFGLVDKEEKLTAFERIPTETIFKPDEDPVKSFASKIIEYSKNNLDGELPDAVSAGFPSTINRDRTVVMQTPNIAAIPDDFAIAKELGEELGIPVFINRDTNNLLFFDMKDLDLESKKIVCGIYFGTGVGNAVMINGMMLAGHNGTAAELGHLPIPGNKRICTCGNEGCIETVVSGLALSRLREEKFPETDISNLFKEKSDTVEIKEFVTGMAQVVATEENLFDPNSMVLGGGLLMNEGFPFEYFEEQIRKYTRKPLPEKNLHIRYSNPDQANGVIGAAIYGFKRLADPEYR